jgi:hypothetical protein
VTANSTTDLRKRASANKKPSYRFDSPGTAITGRVTKTSFWENPQDGRESLVVDLEVDSWKGGRFVLDGEDVVVGKGDLASAWLPSHSYSDLADGLEAAGVQPILERMDGLTVTVTHTALVPLKTNPSFKRKCYQLAVHSALTGSVSDLMDQDDDEEAF